MEERLVYRESISQAGALLLAALGERSEQQDATWRASVHRFGVEALEELARTNRVEAAFGHALDELAGDALKTFVARNAARVQALLALTGQASSTLDAAGIPSALFESGGVLCATALPDGAFGSGDLDMLVSPSDWKRALEILEAMGFEARQRRAEGVHRRELRLLDGEHELFIDLACTPFERMTAPLAFVDRTPLWLKRRIETSRAPGAYTLRPEDLLVQVAIHTSLHQYLLSPGLRLHIDVERLVRDTALDWDVVVKEVAEVGLRTRAFVSLSMARGLLGAAVPDEVLRDLAPEARRVEAIQGLLASEGVLMDEQGKLGGLSALRLDKLLDDRGDLAWLSDLALPSAAWLRPRMAQEGPVPESDWLLHAQRAKRLVKRLLGR